MPPWNSIQPTDRTCPVCGKVFSAKRSTATFCSATCQNRTRVREKPSKEQRAEWRRKRLEKPGYREKVNAQANTRAHEIRRWLDAYKVSVGCCDCGFNGHPSALHFDHIADDKSMNVCNAKSIIQAQAEIEKCVVRCANCHAIKTWPNRLDHT